MELFGVGPTELLFIIVIALIVLGPKDMAKTGGVVGAWLNKFIHSDAWKIMRNTSDELRRLPNRLMRADSLKNSPMPDELQKQAADRKRDFQTGHAPVSMDPGAESKNDYTIHSPTLADAPAERTANPAPRKSAATPRKKAAPAKKKQAKTKAKPAARKKSNA